MAGRDGKRREAFDCRAKSTIFRFSEVCVDFFVFFLVFYDERRLLRGPLIEWRDEEGELNGLSVSDFSVYNKSLQRKQIM